MLLATTNSDLLPRVLRSSLSRAFPATFTPAPSSTTVISILFGSNRDEVSLASSI